MHHRLQQLPSAGAVSKYPNEPRAARGSSSRAQPRHSATSPSRATPKSAAAGSRNETKCAPKDPCLDQLCSKRRYKSSTSAPTLKRWTKPWSTWDRAPCSEPNGAHKGGWRGGTTSYSTQCVFDGSPDLLHIAVGEQRSEQRDRLLIPRIFIPVHEFQRIRAQILAVLKGRLKSVEQLFERPSRARHRRDPIAPRRKLARVAASIAIPGGGL